MCVMSLRQSMTDAATFVQAETPVDTSDILRQAVSMKLRAAGWSDRGLVRENNEDAFGMIGQEVRRGTRPCYVVCDGLGGARAGEVASRTAVAAFLDAWRSADPAAGTAESLAAAAQSANAAVYQLSLTARSLEGMGTTLVALAPHGGRAYVCNVGDSRCYRVHQGTLALLTQDHTLAAEMVREGLLGATEAAASCWRNTLTRVVGMQVREAADVTSHPIEAGDRFLLCSDGVWSAVREAQVLSTLLACSLDDAARRLVELANEAGGADNATALVLGVATEDVQAAD